MLKMLTLHTLRTGEKGGWRAATHAPRKAEQTRKKALSPKPGAGVPQPLLYRGWLGARGGGCNTRRAPRWQCCRGARAEQTDLRGRGRESLAVPRVGRGNGSAEGWLLRTGDICTHIKVGWPRSCGCASITGGVLQAVFCEKQVNEETGRGR